MRAIILAAGRGSRMGELTDNKPKGMVEVGGIPLIQRQISALTKAGVENIAIVTGYLGDRIEPQLETQFQNPNWQSTNMVASLCCAKQWLTESDCIVSYSDIFYDADAVEKLMECDAEIALTYDANWRSLWQKRFDDPLDDAETFQFNSDGILTDIGRRTDSYDEVQGQYMGLLKFSPSAWNKIETLISQCSDERFGKMDMTSLLSLLIQNKLVDLRALPFGGVWGEVDSLSDKDVYEQLYF